MELENALEATETQSTSLSQKSKKIGFKNGFLIQPYTLAPSKNELLFHNI